jgi:hypothetical protein
MKLVRKSKELKRAEAGGTGPKDSELRRKGKLVWILGTSEVYLLGMLIM